MPYGRLSSLPAYRSDCRYSENSPRKRMPKNRPEQHIHSQPRLKYLRRALRQQQTPAEARLWRGLRNRLLHGRKFKRQYSIGPYIVDFYCAEEKLAIELDGAVHNDVLRQEYDDERTLFIQRQGIRVVRVENREVLKALDIVLEAIAWHFDRKSDDM